MIDKKTITEAMDYLEIRDETIRQNCLQCVQEINERFLTEFTAVWEILNNRPTEEAKALISKKSMEVLFGTPVPDYTGNVMVLSGIENFKKNSLIFSAEEIALQRRRLNAGLTYGPVPFINMLWNYNYIRGRLLEVGSLQFEYVYNSKTGTKEISVHIPAKADMTHDVILKTLCQATERITQVFGLNPDEYQMVCSSWLLSKKMNELLPEHSNIRKFYELFEVSDVRPARSSIFHFVFPDIPSDTPDQDLPENTSLQRLLKKEFLKGTEFMTGKGIMKSISYMPHKLP